MDKLYYTKGYCPIPREKKDFLNYFRLKKNLFNKVFFFDLKILSTFVFGYLFLWLVLIFGFFLTSCFKNNHFVFLLFFVVLLHFFFIDLIYLYLINEWKKLEIKCSESITNYEENGSLNGRFWKKPVLNLVQDNLILYFRIRPILKKLIFKFILNNFLFSIFFLFTFFID